MSTDYSAACYTCRREVHLGQRMASLGSFGFGIADHQTIRKQWVWLLEHLEADHDVRIVPADGHAYMLEQAGEQPFATDDLKGIEAPPETNPAALPGATPGECYVVVREQFIGQGPTECTTVVAVYEDEVEAQARVIVEDREHGRGPIGSKNEHLVTPAPFKWRGG